MVCVLDLKTGKNSTLPVSLKFVSSILHENHRLEIHVKTPGRYLEFVHGSPAAFFSSGYSFNRKRFSNFRGQAWTVAICLRARSHMLTPNYTLSSLCVAFTIALSLHHPAGIAASKEGNKRKICQHHPQ